MKDLTVMNLEKTKENLTLTHNQPLLTKQINSSKLISIKQFL